MADKKTQAALDNLNLDPVLNDLKKDNKEPEPTKDDAQTGQWPGPLKDDDEKLKAYKELLNQNGQNLRLVRLRFDALQIPTPHLVVVPGETCQTAGDPR